MISVAIDIWTRIIGGFGNGTGFLTHDSWANVTGSWAVQADTWAQI